MKGSDCLMTILDQMEIIKQDFKECQSILTAIGDETRQSIIITLMDVGCDLGMRVGDITLKTHLSRPAVSHHLKILKEAEIVNVNRVGTLNYYFLEPKTKLLLLKKLIIHVEEVFEMHISNK